MKRFFLILNLFVGSLTLFAQQFIPVDAETFDFIDAVSYDVLWKGKSIGNGKTKIDAASEIVFSTYDSIRFFHPEYQDTLVPKSRLESVLALKRKHTLLEEVVVSSKKYRPVGEKNRIVKRASHPMGQAITWLHLHRNSQNKALEVHKISLGLAQVKYQTEFRICFYQATEMLPLKGHQFLKIRELVYATPVYSVEPGQKNFEAILADTLTIPPKGFIAVGIELIGYKDKNGDLFTPDIDARTRVAMQLSDQNTFYNLIHIQGKPEPEPDLLNVNLSIRYDFANHFFRKPHKSLLLAPAIWLWAIQD